VSDYTLGLGFSHDASAVLLRDGIPVVGVQLERITGRKHDGDRSGAGALLDYVLGAAGISLDDVSVIGAYVPYVGVVDDLRLGPLDLAEPRVLHVSHHLAHAYSAFGPSPFEAATVLVVDGNGDALFGDQGDGVRTGPEYAAAVSALGDQDLSVAPGFETETAYAFSRDGWEVLFKNTMRFSRRTTSTGRWTDLLSVGLDYGQVAEWLFGSRHAAGKVMGLAPYAHDAAAYPASVGLDAGRLLLDDVWKVQVRSRIAQDPEVVHRFDWAAQLAGFAQHECQRAMLALVHRAVGLGRSPDLCLAGGVALNAIANSLISREVATGRMYVQPACSDAGLSLGAALAADHSASGRIRGAQPPRDSLGRRYSAADVDRALAEHPDLVVARCPDPVAAAAERLAAGGVVALFDGGSEFGPRALGHRSILADPRRRYMRDHLNTTVKRREVFRPFAPAVLAELADDWFEVDGPADLMLFTAQVRPGRRELIPAVTHVDGSARLQAVPADDTPYRRLIEGFHRLTQVPLLLNTSFNDAGAPIVETPEQALAAFERMHLDALYLQGRLVLKAGGA